MEGGTIDSPDAELNKNFDLDPDKASTDKCTGTLQDASVDFYTETERIEIPQLQSDIPFSIDLELRYLFQRDIPFFGAEISQRDLQRDISAPEISQLQKYHLQRGE
eukprot:sb/3477872/